MRYHENRFPYFYIENYEAYDKITYKPTKSWAKNYTVQEKTQRPTLIRYWRDYEGAKKATIGVDDYCFKKSRTTRLYRRALPLYYEKGYRFIKILKAPPVGFNYANLPISLARVQRINGEAPPKKKKC